MSILVIAEHDNEEIKASTNNVVTAATNLEGEIHILVAGSNCTGAKAVSYTHLTLPTR